MTNSRRRVGSDVVTVVPPRSVSSRLMHEHDQNDAITARLSWHQDFNDYLKNREDAAGHKASHKAHEEQQNKAKGVGHSFRIMLFWIMALFIFAPLIYRFEMTIIKALFGG